MKENLSNIIIESIKDLNEELQSPDLETLSLETHLYGKMGTLDSIALVRLLVDVECKVSDEFDTTIVLTDERAISQRRSPFRTVKSLTEYIEKLLQEKNDG